MIQELALTDAVGKPFAQLMQDWVLGPIGMTNSTYQQPLPAERQKQAARAHNRTGARSADPCWYVGSSFRTISSSFLMSPRYFSP